MAVEEEFAKEIAKQLPVKAAYHDLLHPAAKQAGYLAEDLIKALRLALFPIQLGAGLQDRFRHFVTKSVARVPEQNRVSPAPQIIGPVLEGVRYEPEGTPIDEMFSQLLSSAMDSDRLGNAHPEFPLIIKQLSSDEAKILKTMAVATDAPNLVQIFQLKDGLAITSIERNELTANDLIFPKNVPMYAHRLERLGLIRVHAKRPMEPITSAGIQTGGRNFLIYKFTETGIAFMRACTGSSPSPAVV